MSEESLNLYAKIEPMIGFYEEYEKLYEIYLKLLKKYDLKNVLDVGCGNGTFLLKLDSFYDAKGIDLSSKMVEIARSKGVNAKVCELSSVNEKFDAIFAVADVLNYMDLNDLEKFFDDLKKALKKDGIFICDVNTLYGFEDIAAGSLNIDEKDRYLGINAEFEDAILQTDITLFEKEGNLYKKESATIFQYYHDVQEIESVSALKLVKSYDFSLFGEQSDKTILIFQNL